MTKLKSIERIKNVLSSKYFRYTFLAIIMGITLYLVITTININDLSKAIQNVNKNYMILGMLLIILDSVLESLVMKNVIDKIYKIKNKLIPYKITIMAIYYNLITPFSSGGQAVQLYMLEKEKIPIGKASSIVVNKFLFFHITITLYSLILAILNFKILFTKFYNVSGLILGGITINFTIFLSMMLVVYNPHLLKNIVMKSSRYLLKFKIFKDVEEKVKKTEKFIDEYNTSAKLVIDDKSFIIKNILLTTIQITVLFSASYCVYRALGLSEVSYIYIITLQSFLYMFVSLAPTPGNLGANELGFYTIFGTIFSQNIVGYAIILYSLLVYYFSLVFSGLITILFHSKDKGKFSY